MENYYDAVDIRARKGPMRIARLHLSGNSMSPKVYDTQLYIIVGSEYGYVHTSSGDVRTWETYSGAWKAWKREKFI